MFAVTPLLCGGGTQQRGGNSCFALFLFYCFVICRALNARMILRKWRFKCSSWFMELALLKTKVELTSSYLMEKQRYSLCCFSDMYLPLRRLLIVSLVYCVIASCWGCSGQEVRETGCCFIFFSLCKDNSVYKFTQTFLFMTSCLFFCFCCFLRSHLSAFIIFTFY